ncbi:MAG: DUF2398 family protein [Ktedonobacteraceae bacterium]|nr:DUF2398 family protein [Ktedonobacteraceae bacterium]
MSELEDHIFLESSPEAEWDEEVFEPSENPSLVQHTTHDVLLAHAALLDNVVVALQTDKETFRLVKGHLKVLGQWHAQHTGWRIQRGSTFFRLERHLHMMLPVFFDEKLKDARDFACLAWILWFAEKRYLAGSGRHQQFLLSELTEEIQGQTQDMSQEGLDIRNVQDRYSIRRSLEYLMHLGCLQVLEGEIKKWAEDTEQEKNEVLYEFTPLAHSLIEALNERHVAVLRRSLQEHPWPAPPQSLPPPAREILPFVRAWRTLLLGPTLLRYDDAEAFAALSMQAEQVNEELGATFGWALDLKRDYACVVRGGGLSIGVGSAISFNGAFDQMLLLLCGRFREQVQQGMWIPDSYGCVQKTQWDILPLFNDLRQRYGAYWGTTVQNAKADTLLEEIYRRMRQVGLLRGPDLHGNILILPTAARYSVRYISIQESGIPATTRRRKQSISVETTLFNWSASPSEQE